MSKRGDYRVLITVSVFGNSANRPSHEMVGSGSDYYTDSDDFDVR